MTIYTRKKLIFKNLILLNIEMSVNINQENIVLRKRKVNINKSKCLDKKIKAQLTMVDSVKSENHIGHNAKRSLKMTYKKLDRTPFKTTNLGRKRLNSRYIFGEQN